MAQPRMHYSIVSAIVVVLGVAALFLGILASDLMAAKPEDAESVPPAKKFCYLCEDGKTFTLEIISSEDCVLLTLDGKPTKLPRVNSGSGARYSNGKTTVWLRGNEAFIEIDGKIIIKNCRVQE